MDRTNLPINSILEQAAHIVRRKKETTGTLEQTESRKRGQTKEMIDFANSNNLWISLPNLNVEFLSKGGENEVYTGNKDNIVIKLNNFNTQVMIWRISSSALMHTTSYLVTYLIR